VHPEGPELPQDDPFLALLKDPRQGRLSAVRLREDRAFWRDFTALFPEEDKGTTPGTLQSAYRIAEDLPPDEGPIPLGVAGQVTDRAKVLEVRRERYPLPRHINLGILRNYIENALRVTEEVATCLRRATWILAARMLSQTREPDPAEVRNLQASFPTLRHYYHHLGASFPGLLLRLDQDPNVAFQDWQKEVEKTAREAWNLTRQTLGTQPRTLKAVQEGERSLAACLRKEGQDV